VGNTLTRINHCPYSGDKIQKAIIGMGRCVNLSDWRNEQFEWKIHCRLKDPRIFMAHIQQNDTVSPQCMTMIILENKSMQPLDFPPRPTDTDKAAKSVFNIENVYLSIGDQIESLLDVINLADLDSTGEVTKSTLSVLALVTIFQYVENIPDRLAREAVQTRTDWKYALHLPLIHPGISPGALYEFRQQLLRNHTAQQVFHDLLAQMGKVGLLNRRTKNWTDVTSIITQVNILTQLDWLAQAFSLTLESLAANQPEVLLKLSLPHWNERYTRMPNTFQQLDSIEDLDNMMRLIGRDTLHLLEGISNLGNPDFDRLQEVQDLKQIFTQSIDRLGNQVKV